MVKSNNENRFPDRGRNSWNANRTEIESPQDVFTKALTKLGLLKEPMKNFQILQKKLGSTWQEMDLPILRFAVFMAR